MCFVSFTAERKLRTELINNAKATLLFKLTKNVIVESYMPYVMQHQREMPQ